MRSPAIAACLLVLWSPFATAADDDAVVIHKRDVPLRTVYAWERWGNFINALPGDGQEIPYDAAKLQAHVYAFPKEQIRVIAFNKGVRTHDHVNMTDTLLYTWTGRRVQFANGEAAITGPGDASFHPKGVFHHGEALQSGFGLEFAVEVDHVWPDPQTTWISAESRPMENAAAWLAAGKVNEVYGAASATAPSDAARFEARTFDFPPYYVAREINLSRGTALPIENSKDRLMFLLTGRASVALEGETWTVEAEDAIRAPAGRRMTILAAENCKIIEADVPPASPGKGKQNVNPAPRQR